MKFYTDIYIKQINFIIKPLPVTRTGGGSASREMETVRAKSIPRQPAKISQQRHTNAARQTKTKADEHRELREAPFPGCL